MKFLKFTLSAPLQSWGEDSRWDNRNTAAMPTKSGIMGLLGCCLGYPRGDERLNNLDQCLSMAVRADSPGRILTDFHTIHGTDGLLLAADGSARRNGTTIISKRQYLQDARFSVFLWCSDEKYEGTVLEQCFEAMLQPKWPVYLGRKSCAPSRPVIPEWIEADTPDEAVSTFSIEEQEFWKNRKISYVSVEVDMMSGYSSTPVQRIIMRHDVIRRADLNEYSARQVRTYTIRLGGGD